MIVGVFSTLRLFFPLGWGVGWGYWVIVCGFCLLGVGVGCSFCVFVVVVVVLVGGNWIWVV